ncbi:unnamed protein product [Bursaphelenchus xylophilus]|uniref:(pine wood nematode) hypothetical protein n=1 Tax=Bursaphelenchus xylophilus TaxID=6326 RepID=A0A1I7RR65_BURXY|nr:unnamed protein product [Bursaphelenchus xylophilus]CAG9130855.1 unnamed protein product [Bursaphelenchus xylophilus]
MRLSATFLGRSTPKWFKPGRKGGVHTYDASHGQVAIGRKFTRTMDHMFGVNTGIENMKIFLSAKSQGKIRHLDPKKMIQLSLLYEEKLAYIIADNDELAELKIQISGVKVPKAMAEIQVYWVCRGDETDVVIQEKLSELSFDLRRELTVQCYGTNVPPLRFVPDRSEVVRKEMDQLFEMADYGVQYRTLSQTAATLGSKKDTGQVKDLDKVPGWNLKR